MIEDRLLRSPSSVASLRLAVAFIKLPEQRIYDDCAECGSYQQRVCPHAFSQYPLNEPVALKHCVILSLLKSLARALDEQIQNLENPQERDKGQSAAEDLKHARHLVSSVREVEREGNNHTTSHNKRNCEHNLVYLVESGVCRPLSVLI